MRGEPEKRLRLADRAEREPRGFERPIGFERRAWPARTAGPAIRVRAPRGRPRAARTRRGSGRDRACRGPCRTRSPNEANAASSCTFRSSYGDFAGHSSNSTRRTRARRPVRWGTRIEDDLGMSLSTIRFRPSPPTVPRERGGGEVLDPDARMEKLGLVAGDDQRGVRPSRSGNVEPDRARETPRVLEDSRMRRRRRARAADRPWKSWFQAASRRGIGREPARRRSQGRLRQQGAVGRGGPQAVGLHHRHPPATSRPAARKRVLKHACDSGSTDTSASSSAPPKAPRLVEIDQRDRNLDDRQPVLHGLDPDLKRHRITQIGDLEPASADVR